MAEKSVRERYLTKLAETKGERAEHTLKKATEKIASVIEGETRYDLLEEQLGYLNAISYRVPGLAADILKKFLNSLDVLNLTYETSKWATEEKLREIYPKNKLRQQALKVLENLRYLKASEAFDTLLEYSVRKDEDGGKTALEGIKTMAKYHIDAVQGLGLKPQQELLEKIHSFDAPKRLKYFSALITICNELLSPTMEAVRRPKFEAITIYTGAVPVTKGLINLRQNTVDFLGELLFLVPWAKEKGRVLNVLQQATYLPHAKYGDDFYQMVIEDTLKVLGLYEKFIEEAPLEIVQAIEHDTYWMFRRRGKDAVSEAALKVRDAINKNEEYKVFKILIGFEGVFNSWEEDDDSIQKFSKIEKLRKNEAKKFAQSISEENYEMWRKRILSYAKIESNDLATFPIFGKFLNHFAETSPSLALRLLTSDAAALDRFLTAILSGVWLTTERQKARNLMLGWIEKKLFLFQIARVFEFIPEMDEELLLKILAQATAMSDFGALSQLVITSAAYGTDDNKNHVKTIFIPSIKALTQLKNAQWVYNFWLGERRKPFIKELSAVNQKIILDNLVFLKDINYRSEEVLTPIAEENPSLIMDFFAQRLAHEKTEQRPNYTAISYELHKLGDALVQHGETVFDQVSEWLKTDKLFQYRGARLLAQIFEGHLSALIPLLMKVAQSGDIGKIDAGIDVLRNLHGEVELHPVFQEFVKASDGDQERLNELSLALETTGVVGGEYGFVEAWKKKQDELRPWLAHEDARVRNFASKYIEDLDRMIEAEARRVEEKIKIRKAEWGENE